MNFQPSPLVICSLQGWLDLNRISVVDKLLATGGALSSSFFFFLFFKKRDNRSFALEEKKTSVGLGVSRLSSYGQTRGADSSTSELFFFQKFNQSTPYFLYIITLHYFFKISINTPPSLSLFHLFCFMFKKLIFIILQFLMFQRDCFNLSFKSSLDLI